MNSNVEIISREIIKPSSQTPDHPKIYELSYFDQFAPKIYVPIIFFYEADESRGLIRSNHGQVSKNLKKSLSETLTSLYPLAGRVRGNGFIVDCNDEGAEFMDARVHCQLTELTQEPNVEQMTKLLPLDPATAGCPRQTSMLLVQLNLFDCGGIAIGICISHQIADTASMMSFITAWAAAHLGQHKTFQLSRHFPAREISDSNTWETLMTDGTLGTKMLVFTKEKLAVLKQMVISSTESIIKDPTRVELVSAFIWQHLSRYMKDNPNKQGSFAAFLAVNLRARVGQKHPILETVFGNFVFPAFVFPESSRTIEEFHQSVRKFRTAIRSINGEDLVDKESQARMVNYISNLFTNREIEWYLLTSWCRFPIYEVDFSWGKPVQVCTSRGGIKNGTVLLDTKDGEGVEVWLTNMDKNILEILETQIKLLI